MSVTQLTWISLDSVLPDDGHQYLVHGTMDHPGKVHNVYVVATKSQIAGFVFWTHLGANTILSELKHINWLHASRLD